MIIIQLIIKCIIAKGEKQEQVKDQTRNNEKKQEFLEQI